MSKYNIHHEADDTLVVNGAGEPIDLWNDLRKHYLRIRRPRRGQGGLRYPDTTIRDVLAIVAIFDRELAAGARDVASLGAERVAWRRATERVARLISGDASDPYGDNAGFWLRDVKRLAVYLSVARYLPTRSEVLSDLADFAEQAPGHDGSRTAR